MKRELSQQRNLPIIKTSILMGMILVAGFVFIAAQIFGL